MADYAGDRDIVLHEDTMKSLDVLQSRAAKRNLLNDVGSILIIAPGRQQQLVVFGNTVLRRHEDTAPRAAVAHLQAEDVAIERDGAFDVAHIQPHVPQRSDFRHVDLLRWLGLLDVRLRQVNDRQAARQRAVGNGQQGDITHA